MESSPGDPEGAGEPRKSAPRRRTKPPLDLSDVIHSGQFKGEIRPRELPQERESRLRIEEARAAHQRWKDKVVLVRILLGLAVVALSCLVVALRPGPSEDKKWAMSILASIDAGGVGYLGGKAGKPE